MYTLANQAPDLRYNVNDSRKKLIIWVGRYGSGNMLGPFNDENVN